MAGAGYKLFVSGDVLTAAQVNNYLMEQSIMRFASSAARTTALSGVLAEGMVSYLDDTNVVEIYNGSSWVSLDDPNAIQNTIVDAKGDIITATANDTPARLAVGANDLVLTADSSQSTGLTYTGGWTTWSPTYSNLTIGNGTVVARYRKFAKMVTVYWSFTLGSTSSVGSTPTVSLPINHSQDGSIINLTMNDTGVARYYGFAVLADNIAYLQAINAAGTYANQANVSATIPFTWGNTDRMVFSGIYEVA